jgi:ABC-2 type transport system permease protein
MTVFKTFLKIVKSCKAPIILYTVILIVFGTLNFENNDNSLEFVDSKPDVYIVNDDENLGITKSLVDYISLNSNIISLSDDNDSLKDALFYRDVNYIIFIPENFRKDFLSGKNPKIDVQSTGDYNSSLAHMMLDKYLVYLDIYREAGFSEDVIISKLNETLEVQPVILVKSKMDSSTVSKMALFYNFANYSMFAAAIYVVCLIMSVFKSRVISNRTLISSMSYKKYNRILFLSNCLFGFVFWLFYVVLSLFLLGKDMFSFYGLFFAINLLFLTVCALSIAFFISNIVRNKEAISGIVTVISLGCSFLCGVFVPMEFLPKSVILLAHFLPSYWYVRTNDYLKFLEVFDFEGVLPIFVNLLVILGFSFLFVILSNFVSFKKRKVN